MSTEEREPFTQDEALKILADGHSIITVEGASRLCQALGIGIADRVPILTWQSAQDALDKYGFYTNSDKPGSGVDLLALGYALCEALDIDPPGRGFTGKGFQAQANAQAIREHLTQP